MLKPSKILDFISRIPDRFWPYIEIIVIQENKISIVADEKIIDLIPRTSVLKRVERIGKRGKIEAFLHFKLGEFDVEIKFGDIEPMELERIEKEFKDSDGGKREEEENK